MEDTRPHVRLSFAGGLAFTCNVGWVTSAPFRGVVQGAGARNAGRRPHPIVQLCNPLCARNARCQRRRYVPYTYTIIWSIKFLRAEKIRGAGTPCRCALRGRACVYMGL